MPRSARYRNPLKLSAPRERAPSTGNRASGESTVSRKAAVCASLIRTTLILNRPRKENPHAESPSDSRKNTAISRRSRLNHDRSPVADVIRHQVDRRCPAAQQLRARRQGGAGIQGPHDSDDRRGEDLLWTY